MIFSKTFSHYKTIGFLLFLSLFLLSFDPVSAQDQTSEQLALQYYQNNEYDKAISLFEDLFNKNPQSEVYYTYFLDCLIKTNHLKEAESTLKNLIKTYKGQPEYSIDLGYIYSLSGNEKKKNLCYQEILKKLPANENILISTANSFLKRNEIDLAIQVLEKGRILLSNKAVFGFTLASLYQKSGDIDKMMNEYFKILYSDPSQLVIVENHLQDYIADQKNYDQIKVFILKAIQLNDYHPAYINLLTWLFVQKRDFEEAFNQQKSLDKRYNINGAELIKLSDICISNKAYNVAEKIFQYILEKGINYPFYYQAKFGLLDVSYLKLTSMESPDTAEINHLEISYNDFLQKDFFQYIDISEKLILRLAELKAIYSKKTGEAIDLLLKYINYPQIRDDVKAHFKLTLGDYYILDNNVWEATLLYSQVDKQYKSNPLGHEAKLRNAKLSFYRGEFDWALDQLDVLKASTSDLVANDAIQLSLLIQDNIGKDSNYKAMALYARADFFIFINQFDSANIIFDSFFVLYPKHSLTDEIYFAKGQLELKRKRFDSALSFFKKVYTDYSNDILADDALFNAAVIYDKYLGDIKKASGLYEKLIIEYPDSVFVVEARKRFREIRGDVIN